MARISYDERVRIFGRPGAVARQMVTTPWGLRVWCHELIAGRFLAACQLADRVSAWRPRRIDSYNYRTVRGSTSASLHGFALAWDFFDLPYPQVPDIWGPTNAPDQPFRDAFKAFGFALGAEFRSRQDFPHVEWADGRPLPVTAVPVQPQPLEEDDMALRTYQENGAGPEIVFIPGRGAHQVNADEKRWLIDMGLVRDEPPLPLAPNDARRWFGDPAVSQ